MNENTKTAMLIAANVVVIIVFALSVYGITKSQRKQFDALQSRIEKIEQDTSKEDAIRKLAVEVSGLQTSVDRQASALRNTLIGLDRIMTQAAAAKPAVHTNAPVAKAAAAAKAPVAKSTKAKH